MGFPAVRGSSNNSGRPQIGGALCPHRRHERLNTHDVHDAGEIVGEYVQRHFAGYPWQRLHQEVGGSHPGLDRAEGMLHRFAPLAHLLRMLIEPALHRINNVLMLPSGDPSLLALGQLCLMAQCRQALVT